MSLPSCQDIEKGSKMYQLQGFFFNYVFFFFFKKIYKVVKDNMENLIIFERVVSFYS